MQAGVVPLVKRILEETLRSVTGPYTRQTSKASPMTRLKLQSGPHLLYAAVSVLNHAIPVDQRLATCSVLNSFLASHVNLSDATYTFPPL